jgi:MFS family permease
MLLPGLWTLLVFALLFGTFYAGFVALAPAVTVDYFGTGSASGIIGLIYSSVALGTLPGPPFAGTCLTSLAGQLAAALGAVVTLLLPSSARWKAQFAR